MYKCSKLSLYLSNELCDSRAIGHSGLYDTERFLELATLAGNSEILPLLGGNRRLGYGLSYVAFAPSRRKRVRRVTECVAINFLSKTHTKSISLYACTRQFDLIQLYNHGYTK
jgi:hypothetical protein